MEDVTTNRVNISLPDDVLWRRTKCGLSMTAAQRGELGDWLSLNRRSERW